MSLKVKATRTPFVLPPEGSHIARCYSVVDLGVQESKAYQKSSPRVRIAWELPNKTMRDGKPFMASSTYNLLFRPNTKLLALLEGWRGKSFTQEERDRFEQEAFDLKVLLGLPCYLTIQHTHEPQYPQPWAAITHASPLPMGLICPPPINPLIYFDLDEYSETAYLAVPEEIRKKINLKDITGLHSPATTVLDSTPSSPADSANTVLEMEDNSGKLVF